MHKSSEVHKRRLDKETRRSMRQRERDVARDQVQKTSQAEAERQERFRVIHGGRDDGRGGQMRKRAGLASQIPSPSDVADPGVVPERFGGAREAQAPITVISVGGRPTTEAKAPSEASVPPTVSAPPAPDAGRPDSGEAKVPAEAVSPDASKPSETSAGPESSEAPRPSVRGKRAVPNRNRAAHAKQQGADAPSAQVEPGQEGDPARDDAADAVAQEGEAPRKPRRARRRIFIVIAVILGIILVLLGLFSWNRWLRYDDALEIQGEWFVAYDGRRAPITIDGEAIVFNEETKWRYTLDTTAKTITFSFGSQTGGGRYWFVRNNEHLVIEDGVGFSAFDTFVADLQRVVTGKADEIPQGSTLTVLSRSADAADAVGAVAVDTSGAVATSEGSALAEGSQPVDAEAPADEGAAEEGAAEEGAAEEGAVAEDASEEAPVEEGAAAPEGDEGAPSEEEPASEKQQEDARTGDNGQ